MVPAGVVLVALALAALRLRRGWSLLRPAYSDPLHSETWSTAGRGLFLARNCVWATLTPQVLHVGLHFPFWTSAPFWLTSRLEWEGKVPLDRVEKVEPVSSPLAGDMVSVSWREHDRPRRLTFKVRHRDTFIDQLVTAARARGAALPTP
jgi:hypothetical protein